MIKNLVNSKFGRASALTMMLSLPFAANADDKCAPLESKNGYTLDANATAMSYSKDHYGTVAISTLPGEDVGNNPSALTGLFTRSKIPAECFVNERKLDSGGTNFTFYVAGLPVKYNGETSFGITDIKNDRGILKAVAAQARTALQLLSNNNSENKNNTTLTALVRD